MTRLDPDMTLALAYVPAAVRPAVEALWRLDAAFGAAIAGGREPMISRIKLAWWREALERLDRRPPPAEPVLTDIAEHVLPHNVTGAALAEMEPAWSLLLQKEPMSAADLDRYAQRGRLLFRHSAELLGGSDSMVEQGGETWALVDLARHSSKSESDAALALAAERAPDAKWPASHRALGMLATLARQEARHGLRRQGSPRRMARMLRHRLTGR